MAKLQAIFTCEGIRRRRRSFFSHDHAKERACHYRPGDCRGTNPENVFICGLSQGGALTLANVLLYLKTLGGGAVLSGWVPFSSSIISQFPEEAKKTPILWSHGTDDKLVLFEAVNSRVIDQETAEEFVDYLSST